MKRFGDWLKGLRRRAAARGRDGWSAACRLCDAGRRRTMLANRWLEPLWLLFLFAFLAASVAATAIWWEPLSSFLRGTGGNTPDAATTNMVIVRNLGLTLAAFVGLVFTWWRSQIVSRQNGQLCFQISLFGIAVQH